MGEDVIRNPGNGMSLQAARMAETHDAFVTFMRFAGLQMPFHTVAARLTQADPQTQFRQDILDLRYFSIIDRVQPGQIIRRTAVTRLRSPRYFWLAAARPVPPMLMLTRRSSTLASAAAIDRGSIE